MSPRCASPQRGFTLLEILFVSVLGALTFASAGAVFQGSNRLSAQAHLRLRALALQRANLAEVVRVLRAAQGSSLSGFDGGGVSQAPGFLRVAGATQDQVTLGEAESIVWRAIADDVDGVASPGALFLTRPSGDRQIARNVPQGGFVVRRQGGSLTVRLTTYLSTDAAHVESVTSDVTVGLRN